MRIAVQPTLLIGLICAIISVITGLYLSEEGGYDDALLERHKVLGIITAVCAVIVFAFRIFSSKYFEYRRKKIFDLVLFIPLIIFLSMTGHYGGSMTHGEDYLFAAVTDAGQPTDPSIKLKAISDVNNAAFYADIIQPILESRCYSCHSSRKQKGDLRLDGADFIRRGGEGGHIVQAGLPDSSALFARLMLPLEHEDHMPPNEKPQPSSSEIALIQSWIKEGADFEMKVADTRDHARIKNYFATLVEQSEREILIPESEVSPGDQKAIAALKRRGIIVLPVAAESNYLSVNFVNARSVSPEDISLLSLLKEQIIWLNLSRTSISDENIKSIAELSSLRRLNLEHTAISDLGVQSLLPLPNLIYLNVIGTKVTDGGIAHLSAAKKLKKLFIYQTSITRAGFEKLHTVSPELEIDTGGYALPKLLTDSVIIEFDPG